MEARAGSRAVAITGVGVVSCCGVGKDAFWNGLCSPAPEGDRRGRDFDATPFFGPKEVRRVDRVAQFAVAAAGGAADEARGRDALGVDPDRSGVILGTGVGGLETLEEQVIVRF